MVSIGEATKHFGVAQSTLRRWDENGTLVAKRTKNGHRRYDLSEIRQHPLHASPKLDRKTIAYVHVSSCDQKDDLLRQAQALELYYAKQGWTFETITDLDTGVNYKKKGLKSLLDDILDNKVERLVITHKDRLLRFGAELVFMLCEARDVEVVIINEGEELSFEQELAQDVLEIITVFPARLYGSRSKKNQQLIEAVKKAL
ncbi:IS607 family transposase [Psychrobacter sp. SIMBA_152]